MLVLSRKIDQSIQIGDDITITILKVKGNTVRIGIGAPKSVRVVRGELEALPSADKKAGAKREVEKETEIRLMDSTAAEPSEPDGVDGTPSIIEFRNDGLPEVRHEPIVGSQTDPANNDTRFADAQSLPLSRFCRKEYRVEQFRMIVDVPLEDLK